MGLDDRCRPGGEVDGSCFGKHRWCADGADGEIVVEVVSAKWRGPALGADDGWSIGHVELALEAVWNGLRSATVPRRPDLAQVDGLGVVVLDLDFGGKYFLVDQFEIVLGRTPSLNSTVPELRIVAIVLTQVSLGRGTGFEESWELISVRWRLHTTDGICGTECEEVAA